MLLGGGFERDTKQLLGLIRNQHLLEPSHNKMKDDDEDHELSLASYSRQTLFSAISIPHIYFCCRI